MEKKLSLLAVFAHPGDESWGPRASLAMYAQQGVEITLPCALIRAANQCGSPILSLDVPSGVDAASEAAYAPAIRAVATLTLALPKEGLRSPAAREYVGELYLGNISVPWKPCQKPPLNIGAAPIFAQDDIIRLW